MSSLLLLDVHGSGKLPVTGLKVGSFGVQSDRSANSLSSNLFSAYALRQVEMLLH